MNATRQFVLFSFITSLAISSIVVEYTPFLYRIGFSFSGIALLQFGYVALIALFEVPSGVFADMRGCKSAVQWSQVVYVTGAVFYALASERLLAIAAMVFTAVSFALQSGARNAWLLSQMPVDATPESQRKAITDSVLASQVAAFFGPMISSWIKARWSINCFWVSAVLSVIGFLLTMFWKKDVPVVRAHRRWSEVFAKGREAALRFPLLRWFGWMSIVFALVQVVNHQWSLVLSESHSPLQGYSIWMAMQIGLIVGSLVYRQLPNKHGAFAMVVSFALAGGCLMFAAPRSPDIAWVMAIAVLQVVRSLFQVGREHAVQVSAPPEVRATVNSWISLVAQIGMMLMLVLSSLVTIGQTRAQDAAFVTWLPAGIVLLFGSMFFYWRYRKIGYSW